MVEIELRMHEIKSYEDNPIELRIDTDRFISALIVPCNKDLAIDSNLASLLAAPDLSPHTSNSATSELITIRLTRAWYCLDPQ